MRDDQPVRHSSQPPAGKGPCSSWKASRWDRSTRKCGSCYNIAGPEVEAALLGHPDVAECAVVGIPDEERGHIVQAHVVLTDGVDGDDACVLRLQTHVKAAIAPYKYPRSIEFHDALPKTQTGKIQRFRLRGEIR